MERKDDRNTPRRQHRIDQILDVVANRKPDLLVCAGDFLKNKSDLQVIANYQTILSGKTKIVTDYDVRKGKKKNNGGIPSPLYLIEPSGKVTQIARQCASRSREFSTKHGPKTRKIVKCFKTNEATRVFKVKNITCSCLVCGEINFFAYKINSSRVHPRDKVFGNHYDAVRLIVNPTHDRMGDSWGALTAKRKYLSRPLSYHKRCYVSTSNWEIRKPTKTNSITGVTHKQTPHATNLHTVYVDGNQKNLARIHNSTRMMEYRKVNVRL